MSFGLSIPRWRLRLGILGAVVLVGLLMVGAKEVTTELRQRPALRRETDVRLREWSRALLSEVSGGLRDDWQRLAETHPEWVLRACARESREVWRADE